MAENNKLWTVQEYTYDGVKEFKVNEEWLSSVENLDDIEEITLHKGVKERLEVLYKDGDVLWYENVFGTWGFPTRFE